MVRAKSFFALFVVSSFISLSSMASILDIFYDEPPKLLIDDVEVAHIGHEAKLVATDGSLVFLRDLDKLEIKNDRKTKKGAILFFDGDKKIRVHLPEAVSLDHERLLSSYVNKIEASSLVAKQPFDFKLVKTKEGEESFYDRTFIDSCSVVVEEIICKMEGDPARRVCKTELATKFGRQEVEETVANSRDEYVIQITDKNKLMGVVKFDMSRQRSFGKRATSSCFL